MGKEGREEGRDDYGGGGRGVGAKTIVQNNVPGKIKSYKESHTWGI